ncbi:MAG: hypothetical protein H6839_13550 [Planctomycetes bacterium]|nr:hypothetical protein [Planctomycetota bacterium]
MKLRLLSAVIALGLLSVVGLLAQDAPTQPAPEPEKKVVLVDSAENLLSREIWGKWETNRNFTKFVQDGLPKDDFGKVEFKKNDDSTARITKALEELVVKMVERGKPNDLEFERAVKAVYATGKMILDRGKDSFEGDFALITMFGEQLIVIRSGKEDKPAWETDRVSFVRDADGDHDLLFIGTDTKEGKFTALNRDGVK